MPHFARRKDSTHQAVLDALRVYGWSVMDVARAPLCIGLVIAKAGRVVLVEVKDRTGKLTEAQKALLASWPGETAVLRSLEDVARLTAIEPGREEPADRVCQCGHGQFHHTSWGDCLIEACGCKEFYEADTADAPD